MSHNQIRYIPEMENLKKLEILWLNDNKIEVLTY